MATFRKRLGRWRVEVVRAGVRESKTFDSKADAAAWATRREAELLFAQGRTGTVRGSWSVGDAFSKYAKEVSPKKRGARWEKVRLAKLELDELAKVRVSALRPNHIAEWRDRRLRDVSGSSVLREMNLLRSVFERARKEWGWLRVNPMIDVERPQKPAARDRRVTDDEIERLCLALGWQGGTPKNQSQRIAIMLRIAIETAMRSGELCGLPWSRLHLPEKYAQLRKTKNGEARKVPLSKEAVRLFELLPRDGELVFDVTDALRDALFRKARKAAGIEDLTFHDTRHEAITRLARKLDVLDLARMIGHRDLRSLRVYYNATATEIADRLG